MLPFHKGMEEKYMKKKVKGLYKNNWLSWLENSEFILAMRRGLLLCIPFLIMGSFCIVLTSFPVPAWQEWIRKAAGGWIYQAVMWIYNATMGSVTLFVILAVSYSYGSKADHDELGFYMLTAVTSYVVFASEDITAVSFTIFDSTWLFTGIIVTLFSCLLFRKFYAFSRKSVKNKYETGVDMDFRNTVLVIIPVICVILIFAAVKLVLAQGMGVNIQNIGSYLMMHLFGVIGTGAFGAVVFVFLIHIMWFFGIHGSNMLSMVSEQLFEQGMVENMAAVAAGGAAAHVFTKTFFDVFVLMGGSGATLSLLLAMLVRRKKKDKTLFKVSIIPALFNVNEIVLFGLPVVFNPIMLIPFILVPLVLLGVSAFSIAIGLVPVPSVQVTWTTPILFSGYLCTGSVAGAILQAVNLVLGAAIYTPFIRLSEVYYDRMLQKNVLSLVKELQECEEKGEYIVLKEGPRSKRDIVKMLTKDLETAVRNHGIMLYYQPQVMNDGSVYGVEALLRWKHPVVGYLYPPLVIELARQDDMLDELGLILIEKAAGDLEHLSKIMTKPIHMSVNISPVQFESNMFCGKVKEILDRYDFGKCTMCFEVTEQLALSTTEIISERIEELRRMGIPFHMDDFGMGHSSMKYLQNNEFEAVKLDGSLVRDMLDNTRSQEIISGIQQMALPLNYELIAEYVETKEQKNVLEGLGCHIYQGALYGMAVPLNELEDFLKEYHMLEDKTEAEKPVD